MKEPYTLVDYCIIIICILMVLGVAVLIFGAAFDHVNQILEPLRP